MRSDINELHYVIVLQTQMRKGFERVEGSLDDIALDSPHVKTAYNDCKEQALQEKWLIQEAT